MTLVVVPVRYPLGRHSRATLSEAIDVAAERDADLVVFHVDLYQDRHNTTRDELKAAVEREFGSLDRARYVVRRGFLVEESILDEAMDSDADVVVIGSKRSGRLRRVLRGVLDGPDVASFLRERLDAAVVTVEG
jgi:nucleotide-binding universal stress UspA family protein